MDGFLSSSGRQFHSRAPSRESRRIWIRRNGRGSRLYIAIGSVRYAGETGNCGRRNPPGALIGSSRWFLLAALGLFSSHVLAQGCASCYTTDVSGRPQTAPAITHRLLTVLGPPRPTPVRL